MKRFLLVLLFSLYFLQSAAPAFAQNYQCKLANIEPNTNDTKWNVTYCVTADTPAQLDQINSGKMTCRRAPSGATGFLTPDNQNCSCHDPYSLDDLFPVTEILGVKVRSPFPDPRYVLLVEACGVASLLNFRELETYEDNNLPHQYDTLRDETTGQHYTCFTFSELERNMGAVDTEFSYSGGIIKCGRADVTPGDYTWKEYWDNTLRSTLGIGLPFYEQLSSRSLFCTGISRKGVDFKAINTALGCIATDPLGFTKDYLTISIGIGGALALLLLLYAFFTIATAAGNPAKVQLGQQIISSVIQGLIIIALSVVLLNFLGINVLGLPGLV